MLMNHSTAVPSSLVLLPPSDVLSSCCCLPRQVHVPLSHIEHYAAGHGGTTSWQTFVCPVYSHASTSSKIGRKPKSGTHSAQYPETGLAGSDAVWDDEGETAGRWVPAGIAVLQC